MNLRPLPLGEWDWVTGNGILSMLEHLRDRLSERKFRLLACACVRVVEGMASDFDCRGTLDVAERMAEMGVAPDDYEHAEAACALAAGLASAADVAITNAAWSTLHLDAKRAAFETTHWLRSLETEEMDGALSETWARILRCIAGNSFRPVTFDPSWLTSTVLALARSITDERAFDRLPILADALQDAGCADDDILNHCRGPGPHARGCWVVDLVLGKA